MALVNWPFRLDFMVHVSTALKNSKRKSYNAFGYQRRHTYLSRDMFGCTILEPEFKVFGGMVKTMNFSKNITLSLIKCILKSTNICWTLKELTMVFLEMDQFVVYKK